MELAKCMICGVERKLLKSHIKKVHNLTIDEYKSMYPNSKIISDEYRSKMSESAKKCWTDSRKEDMSNRSKNMWKDEEFRAMKSKKSSEFMKNRWEDEEYRKHISECSSKHMKEQWKDNNFRDIVSKSSSSRLTEMWKDEEYRNNISNKRKDMWKDDEYRDTQHNNLVRRWEDEEYRKHMKDSISSAQIYNWKTEEYRNSVINGCISKYGVPYNCMTENCISESGKIVSKINLEFSKFLLDNNIDNTLEFHIGKYSYDIHIVGTEYLIEIDPTYTHNSTNDTAYSSKKPIDYHSKKSIIAESNGYKCIHVFDWDNYNNILDIVNPRKNIVYARKCIISEVSNNECNDFLNINHLQGTCRSQLVRLGLYYNNELVQIMTFGKPRYNKNYQYELLRLCTKSGTLVIGGSERLFNYFIKNYNPESIISYCDNSKFSGEVYERIGMKYLGISNPSCHWYNYKQHITDNLLRQHGFDRLLGNEYGYYGKGTDNNLLMIEHGFVQIYDCGQKTYIWR